MTEDVKRFLILLLSCAVGIFIDFIFKKTGINRGTNISEKSCKSSKQAAIFALCSVIILWFFQSNLTLWERTDDYYISCVVNSLYADENYCIFLNPILTDIVRLIDIVFPNADRLVLFGEILILAGLWCIFYIIFRNFRLLNSVIIVFLTIAINSMLNLLHQPFTSITGELAIIGFFILYAVISGKVNKKFAAAGTVYVVFSALWRYEAFLMTLPFFLLIILTDLYSRKKDRKKMILSVTLILLPAVIISSFCIIYKNIVDTGDKYGYGVSFNDSRSEMVDYPRKTFEICGEELEKAGMSENDFSAAKSLIISDTETFTADYLKKMCEITRPSYKEKIDIFKESALDSMMKIISYRAYIQIILISAVLIAVVISDTEKIYKAELLLACVGALVIWVFFTYLGHMISYMLQVLLYGEILVILSFFLNHKLNTMYGDAIRSAVFCFALVLFVQMYSGFCLSPEKSVLFARDSDIVLYTDIDDSEDTILVWGVHDYNTMLKQSQFVSERKLLPEEFISHNIVDGEWMYAQPYYIEYMKKIGMENPMKALLYREHTYYAANPWRCMITLKYLKEHYNENTNVEPVGNADLTPIWKFSID